MINILVECGFSIKDVSEKEYRKQIKIALQKYKGDAVMADRIALDTYGKPIIPKEKLHFNLSHSGDYVVLAVDEGGIGIDIEKTGPLSNEIVKHCFTKEEQKWLASQPIEHAYYLLWTGKESIMKAIGKGFYMEPKSFSVLPIRDGVHHIDEYDWYLQWHEYDNHVICVTSKTTERKELCFLCRDEIQHKCRYC